MTEINPDDYTRIAPTPGNYDLYELCRILRTERFIGYDRIKGRQVKHQNLSMKMLIDYGFRYDPVSGDLVKDPLILPKDRIGE